MNLVAAAEFTRPEKEFSTLQARAALILGATLIRVETEAGDPAFVLERWGIQRTFTDLASVKRWLDRLEVGR